MRQSVKAQWKLWYRDTFDRECPPQIDAQGQGLRDGLIELWARHLFETVRPESGRGFSRFYLQWTPDGRAEIKGDMEGARRLRKWIFGDQKHTRGGYVQAGDKRLLTRVATAHHQLLAAGQTSAPILALARTAASRRAFVQALSDLAPRRT